MSSEQSGCGIQEARMPDRSEVKVIRMKGLSELLSVSRSTLYDWLNPSSPRHDAAFPRPIRLSAKGGAVGWRFDDVVRWLDTRK